MVKRNGFLWTVAAIVALLAAHHILSGMTRAPVTLENGITHQFYDWENGRRYLSISDGSDCETEKRKEHLSQRVQDLSALGYNRNARVVDTNGARAVFEGFLRGVPVLYSPCEGTYLAPSFVLGTDEES